jgi:hypothetical protein
MRYPLLSALLLLASCGRHNGDDEDWLVNPAILVDGVGVIEPDCRTKICPHNENTDMISYHGAAYLIHRTAESQVLGPNSSLRVMKSTDKGATFQLLAIIPSPTATTYPSLGDRDMRDPSLYVVNDQLVFKAITRLPVTSTRDSNVDSITVSSTSSDGGSTWSPLTPIGPEMWSFWRVKQHAGAYYSAAYQDGDMSVKLFTSADGVTWSPGAVIYDVAADTPLETELEFMPSGRMLALVRMDGTTEELLGNVGRLRTKICWAMPPYDHFDCPQEFDDQRLDGPVSFWHGSRLFVVARKHFIGPDDKKRTSLFEIGGTLEGGPLTITEHGELPSAGDTAYAGVVDVDADHTLVSWYSSYIMEDAPWARAILEASDIWMATIDFGQL